ncbi:ATP-binding protein [Sphingomonas sp. BIUV-7]|uniref:histidine kinase n=1 Tax=Sphingomonas natans TaxID=3063330 RepID=A0ABT8Y9B9_9SPHN|nr:ATP-binding protein [Sphingomonas sp. BIUV-7]MDO6414931.1 ATP-binding protein [Sphingomonas sp. BIUV-7]
MPFPADPARYSAALAGGRNMLLLSHLRLVALLGQLVTILVVRFGLNISLPLGPMIAVVAALAGLNIWSLVFLARGGTVTNRGLFLALLVDFAALTAQFYMSGGATNPFAPIGLLQIVIGAVLLEAWSSWVLLVLHSIAFGLLSLYHRPLALPEGYASAISPVQLFASWVNFVLVAVLLVFFVTRISRNLRQRDASIARMQQQAAEEDHIVRMGLLASGAAHELGTPLSSLSVILGDWRKQPALAADPEEIAEMQAAVARCKDIVGGILYAAGEARGEDLERTTLRHFLVAVTTTWSAQRPGLLTLDDKLDPDPEVVVDRTLAQILTNILENAAEAEASRIEMNVRISEGIIDLTVTDDGVGFPPAMLETIGQPYRSSKDRRGAGLGLFLAVNVLRKLGGTVAVRNGAVRGAVVTLMVPLAALTPEPS